MEELEQGWVQVSVRVSEQKLVRALEQQSV
jgi:hypothetical protein